MAAIYDVSTSLIDDEEYAFYNAFIQENNCKTILEIERNGHLAKRFKKKPARLYRFGI
jgi:hypothetical protein